MKNRKDKDKYNRFVSYLEKTVRKYQDDLKLWDFRIEIATTPGTRGEGDMEIERIYPYMRGYLGWNEHVYEKWKSKELRSINHMVLHELIHWLICCKV